MLFFVVESGANQRWAKFLSGAGRVGQGGSAVPVAVAAVAVVIYALAVAVAAVVWLLS